MSVQTPERAHVLTMTVSADTVDDLARELNTLADRLLMDKLTTGVSGGPNSGTIYSYKIRPEQTHGVYFDQVNKWLQNRSAAGACAVQDTASS
jgi:hypothetical protein